MENCQQSAGMKRKRMQRRMGRTTDHMIHLSSYVQPPPPMSQTWQPPPPSMQTWRFQPPPSQPWQAPSSPSIHHHHHHRWNGGGLFGELLARVPMPMEETPDKVPLMTKVKDLVHC
ncbi:putative protein isoform X2 [Capsicum annuum]|uniref:uncharacterized protein LOC107866017 isoform X2 n=1 Tax=Capsicum annuum TaxID=4072 RepID=UPI0007BF9181|nr:uncharacterized protein LOC107866017 isoform X2 [Capsicum annuum]